MAAIPIASPTMNRPTINTATSGAIPITTDPKTNSNDANPITVKSHGHMTTSVINIANSRAVILTFSPSPSI